MKSVWNSYVDLDFEICGLWVGQSGQLVQADIMLMKSYQSRWEADPKALIYMGGWVAWAVCGVFCTWIDPNGWLVGGHTAYVFEKWKVLDNYIFNSGILT